jgi:hypothetical protein
MKKSFGIYTVNKDVRTVSKAEKFYLEEASWDTKSPQPDSD